MTVRVNKSSFNIREKLSELERPIGLKGSELMRSETAQDARDFVSAGRKNYIINGDFKIWQRGTSGGVGNGNRTYRSADRWFNFNAGDTTSQLNLSSENIGGVTGRFRYGMRVSGSQSSRILGQCVEGPLPAGDYVFSAWVRFSEIPTSFYMTHNSTALTGENNFAGWYGGSGTAVSYTEPDNVGEVAQTGVWYHVYKKFTAVSPHLGLGIAFQPVFGASTAATMDIAGVQLEVGKNATEFEHRSFGKELALCMRYYEKSFEHGFTPAHGSDTTSFATFKGIQEGPAHHRAYMPGNTYGGRSTFTIFRVPKRTTPSVGLYGNSNGDPWGYGGVGWITGSWGVAANEMGFEWVNEAQASSTLHVQAHWTASAEL